MSQAAVPEKEAPPLTSRAAPRPRWAARAWAGALEGLAGIEWRVWLADLTVQALPRDYALSLPRAALYRMAGATIGARSLIFGRIHFTGPPGMMRRLRIGSHCTINSPLFIELNADVTIGDRVAVGHHTVLITAGHEIGTADRRAGPLRPAPIRIGDGSFIAACVTILPGVTIGAGSVVAPGSLVAADVPPGKLVGGVPARVLKSLE